MSDPRTPELEVEGLYKVLPLRIMRKTQNVCFDSIPIDAIPSIDAVDRVIHGPGAFSPGTVGDVKRPWYMHTHQTDNLIVMHGLRNVELYQPEHGRVEHFIVTPDIIKRNGHALFNEPAILSWPTGVFHRVVSGEDGSASINFASHAPGLDVRTNFNIYGLDTTTGDHRVIREGHLDQ